MCIRHGHTNLATRTTKQKKHPRSEPPTRSDHFYHRPSMPTTSIHSQSYHHHQSASQYNPRTSQGGQQPSLPPTPVHPSQSRYHDETTARQFETSPLTPLLNQNNSNNSQNYQNHQFKAPQQPALARGPSVSQNRSAAGQQHQQLQGRPQSPSSSYSGYSSPKNTASSGRDGTQYTNVGVPMKGQFLGAKQHQGLLSFHTLSDGEKDIQI